MAGILVIGPNYPAHSDSTKQWKILQPGDGVDANDDDTFFWGTHIQTDNPGWWLVGTVTDTTADQLLGFMLGDDSPSPAAPYRLRTCNIDIAGLMASSAAQNTGNPSGPDFICDLATLMTFYQQRPALDPSQTS